MHEIDLELADSGTTLRGFHVLREGGDFYRIVDVPTLFVQEFGYMDVVELVPSGDGTLEFKRVVTPGGWRRFDVLVSRDVAESKEIEMLLERVDSSGGRWVRDFGGCLSILLQPGSTWDPMPEIKAIGAA